MSWVAETLTDFGRSMGIPDLAFNDRGLASLAFDRLGTLYMEACGEQVLVYLVRPLDHPTAEHYARALEICHWQHNHLFPVNPAIRHTNQLVFSVRVPQQEFSLPTLEGVVALLEQLHGQVREGVVV